MKNKKMKKIKKDLSLKLKFCCLNVLCHFSLESHCGKVREKTRMDNRNMSSNPVILFSFNVVPLCLFKNSVSLS